MNYSGRCRLRAAVATVIISLVAMTVSAEQSAETRSFPTVRPIGQALQVNPPFSFDKKKTARHQEWEGCARSSP